MSLFGILAVLAAIFAVLFRRAIAGGMRTFVLFVLRHKLPCFPVGLFLESYPKTHNFTGQG